MNQLETIVRQYAVIPNNATQSGWHPVRCLVCNDHKHKKRGGWKFEGPKTTYHCFNCAISASYTDGGFLSDDIKRILHHVGVPDAVVSKLKFESFKQSKRTPTTRQAPTPTSASAILLPKQFRRVIDDPDDVWSQLAQEYLFTRGMDIDDYKFYMLEGQHPTMSKWKGRLIIPMYRGNDLIFYQGRDLVESTRSKYLGCDSTAKGLVLYGMDELYKDVDQPLFVVEGFFDAFHINGVAILGNEMSEHQIQLLNASPRKKIIVPDRFGDGHLLANQGIQQGWSVSVLPFDDCKDVNDAIVKFGKLFVIQQLMQHTVSGFEATVRVNMLCEKGKSRAKKQTRSS